MPAGEEQRAAIEGRLADFIASIEHHRLWAPPNLDKTLYYVWDFAQRSKYMLSEYENIKQGKPLTYPDQFRPAPGTGVQAAENVFQDICGRCILTELLVTDKSGRTAIMTGQLGAQVDFGAECKEKVRALTATVAGQGQPADG